MNRTTFLIDGFNLYHSLKQASYDMGLGGRDTRWLNLLSFCQSYLPAIRDRVGDGRQAVLKNVFYFSAFARHLEPTNPDITRRHRKYIDCLRGTGVIVEMGRFKEKEIHCNLCHRNMKRHEEKETDVAVSVKVMEICALNECDTVVIVTGDTDIAPAIRSAKRLFVDKNVCVVFPYGRHNQELKNLVDFSFHVKKDRYRQFQFSDPYVLRSGMQIIKPQHW